jgi:hypothetical protein
LALETRGGGSVDQIIYILKKKGEVSVDQMINISRIKGRRYAEGGEADN